MKINEAGRSLIKTWEALRLETYKDPVGIPTVGWGHTKGVTMGQTITEAEAEVFLSEDLEDAENAVYELTRGFPITPNQFAAMVSLCFNIGISNFQKSSVLRTFRAGDLQGASESFKVWNKAGRPLRILPGLTERRAAEATLFRSP